MSSSLAAQPFLLPEFQIYHSLGTRNSSFTTLAAGITFRTSDPNAKPTRTLQTLILYVPPDVLGAGGKVGDWLFESDGIGLEIGLNDKRARNRGSKDAKISYRRILWSDVHLGQERGEATQDTIHLGWSAGETLMGMLGVDFSWVQPPKDPFLEIQLAIGARIGF